MHWLTKNDVYILDTNAQAETIAAKKKRLRRIAPVDYCEREEKKQLSRRPLNGCARIKGKIKIKIERISNIKKALYIRNQQRDKQKIQDPDVDAIDDLFDESDDDSVADIDEIEARPSSSANTDESMDDLVEIVAQNGLTTNAGGTTSAIAQMEVDTEFSLEYSFVVDVSCF